MRLWSIHPKYLDSKGLVALWREGLLAKNVLEGKTVGYKNHPQLDRFKRLDDPVLGICRYLMFVEKEARSRGYSFDKEKIAIKCKESPSSQTESIYETIIVTTGQITYEFDHLLAKLDSRDNARYKSLKIISSEKLPIDAHPMFKLRIGNIEPWEITK